MNDPSLPNDARDELLSAELDGGLDDAAADLGLTAAAARERIAATPGAATRRELLAAARDVGSTPPVLPEPTRQALVDAALARAGTPGDELATRRAAKSRTRFLVAVSGAAAALALVTGLAIAVSRDGSSRPDADLAATGAPEGARNGGALVEEQLGDVSDPGELAARVQRALDATPRASSGSDSRATEDSARADTRVGEYSLAGRCADDLAARDEAWTDPEAVFHAKYQGDDVQVFVFRDGDGAVAVVVDPACAVRATQPIPRSP